MFNSIRARLTLWYTGVLALVLITFSAISYALLAQATRSATDSLLAAALHEVAPGERDAIVFSANTPQLKPEERARVLALAHRGASGFYTIEGGDEGDGLRVAVQPMNINGSRYVAVAVADLDPEADRLELARHALLLGIPLALLVAAVGGYILAHKSLEPVVEMSEAQRRFMADASHELRTPISIIQGEADVTLARDDRSPAEYRESLEIIRKSSRKLTRIVQNIFLLARSDAGTYPVDRSRFYLDEVLSDSVRAMRTVASAKQIDLQCAAEPELPIVGDEELVHRMLLNLLDNAVKFTPEHGRVSVTVNREDHAYVVRVADTAAAVPASERSHIFERFYRASSAGGAGLGLTIVRWVAEVHGGSVVLEEGRTDGNTFRVTLPA